MGRKDSKDVSITLPKILTDEIDKYVKKYPRYNSRSGLIKFIVNNWLDEQAKFEKKYKELKKLVKKQLKKKLQ